VRPLVLDTNIALDLLLFQDPATVPLLRALTDANRRWLATAPMRQELVRVLSYAQIVKSLAHHGLTDDEVLAGFDLRISIVAAAPKATATCRDSDDQMFIDLAVAHKAVLLSKDRAVLCMGKRLLALDVVVQKAFI
jgi:putative PIN family toxin of toxin-antitoxin system